MIKRRSSYIEKIEITIQEIAKDKNITNKILILRESLKALRENGTHTESIELFLQAFDDYKECETLLAQNPDNDYLKRALVKESVVLLETWCNMMTYLVETTIEQRDVSKPINNLIFGSNLKFENDEKFVKIQSRWVNLDLSDKDSNLIKESSSGNLDSDRLKETIKLLESFLKLDKKFDFNNIHWQNLTEIFKQRNGFNHPKELKDFDISDPKFLWRDCRDVCDYLFYLFFRYHDLFTLISYENCSEICGCGRWQQEDLRVAYNKAKLKITGHS